MAPLPLSSTSPPSPSPIQAEEGSEMSHPRSLRILFPAEVRARRRFPGRTLGLEGRSGQPARAGQMEGRGASGFAL